VPVEAILDLSMSKDDVAVVQRALEQFNTAGDVPWHLIDPAVEWIIDPDAFVGGTYRGHDGLRTMLSDLGESFARIQFDFDEWVDAGDLIAALGRLRVQGDQSGVGTTQPIGYVFQVRKGRIAAARAYLQPEEALAAVGLKR
jgi:ketosteroid isomerase-like protein